MDKATARFFEQVEICIRLGRIGEARRLMGELKLPKAMSPSFRIHYANLRRRTGRPEIALRVLSSLLLEKSSLNAVSTPVLLEYANCLRQMNVLSGVSRVLHLPALAGNSKSLLLRGQTAMHLWEYEEARKNLVSFLEQVEPSSYEGLLARVNLVACLVAIGREEEALSLLRPLQTELKKRQTLLLLFNAIELEVQIHASAGRSTLAMNTASRISSEGLSQLGTIDSFYLEKWQLIAQLKSKQNSQTIGAVKSLRAKLTGRAYSEIRRDIDLMLGMHHEADPSLDWIYFATPQSGFRRRILQISGMKKPESTLWKLGGSETSSPILELSEWVREKNGSLTAKLLVAMLRDGYRPVSVIEIFDLLYPNSVWNPDSSPGVVQQILFRLRKELRNEGIRLDLQASSGGYHVMANPPLHVRVSELPDFLLGLDRIAISAEELKKNSTEFRSARELAGRFGEPLRTTQLRLKQWQERGTVIKRGRGRATQYQFTQSLVQQ